MTILRVVAIKLDCIHILVFRIVIVFNSALKVVSLTSSTIKLNISDISSSHSCKYEDDFLGYCAVYSNRK
jgi:hypothetical protein